MTEPKQTSCCSKATVSPKKIVSIDPVCGMTVAEDSQYHIDLDELVIYFVPPVVSKNLNNILKNI